MNGLHHIGVFVSDIEKSIAFYVDKLGYTVDRRADMGSKLAFISLGSCKIELIQPQQPTPRENGKVDHICMLSSDIHADVKALKAKGVAFDAEEPTALPALGPNAYNIFFTGPDGERLEIFQD